MRLLSYVVVHRLLSVLNRPGARPWLFTAVVTCLEGSAVRGLGEVSTGRRKVRLVLTLDPAAGRAGGKVPTTLSRGPSTQEYKCNW